MPRTRAPDRLDDLVRAATEVFIQQGYRRTQMTDVARALGVAKGTVYLYVESKEALFDLVLRHADDDTPVRTPEALPIPTPDPDSTVRYVEQRLASDGRLPALTAALARRRVADAEKELEGIVSELYDVLARNRTAIKLVDRCGADFPELARVFRSVSREGVPGLLEDYLQSRARRGHFRVFDDTAIAARMVMELCVFWSVHIHWDATPIDYEPTAVRDTVIRFAKGALLA